MKLRNLEAKNMIVSCISNTPTFDTAFHFGTKKVLPIHEWLWYVSLSLLSCRTPDPPDSDLIWWSRDGYRVVTWYDWGGRSTFYANEAYLCFSSNWSLAILVLSKLCKHLLSEFPPLLVFCCLIKMCGTFFLRPVGEVPSCKRSLLDPHNTCTLLPVTINDEVNALLPQTHSYACRLLCVRELAIYFNYYFFFFFHSLKAERYLRKRCSWARDRVSRLEIGQILANLPQVNQW